MPSGKVGFCGFASLLFAAIVIAAPAQAQFAQQGNKLVGTGATGNAQQGQSVALSADGNTMLIGGSSDNSSAGAVWVFTRSGGMWTQQGNKLVGTGATGNAQQGISVALSADGNTALIGGPNDDFGNGHGTGTGIGAAWVFTRSGSTWTQQGNKLIGSGGSNGPTQGASVALSADGNTALIGGECDNNFAGATWVFVRDGNGNWTQQGNKLVGTNASADAGQGHRVAVSADGNTVLIGGPADNGHLGAVWVFTRSGGTWAQQGNKLVGTGAVFANSIPPVQGTGVALSGDGNTALVGGQGDNSGTGAGWVFTRSGSTWTQQGSKLVRSGANISSFGGSAVVLSGDGNTALLGAINDGPIGDTWVFTRSGSIWTQQGDKLVGSGAVGNPLQGQSVALSADGGTAAIGGLTDDGNKGAAWVFVQPLMTVAPASNVTMAGNAGGPFSPPSTDYVLSAPTAVNYSVSGVPDWLTASATSGELNGGSKATISLTANATAAGKAAGTYGPATITFTNTTNGVGNASITATLTVGAAASAVSLLSAVLPASRSVQVGTAATAFATIINTSGATGTSCGLGLGSNVPASFQFQTTDPATNAVSGTLNAPSNIPGGGSQSFVFAITPSAAFDTTDLPIVAGCSNGGPAPTVVGLNTLLMSGSTTPVADIVALAATVGNDGIVNIPGANGAGAFAVATVNVGASVNGTVTADTGSVTLPVTITICPTNQSTGQCLAPPSATVSGTIASNATPTFGIFVQGAGNVPFDPAKNRVFVRFRDGGNVVRGATSVAVRTQ